MAMDIHQEALREAHRPHHHITMQVTKDTTQGALRGTRIDLGLRHLDQVAFLHLVALTDLIRKDHHQQKVPVPTSRPVRRLNRPLGTLSPRQQTL